MISDYYTETVTFASPTTSTGWAEPGYASASSTFSAAVNPAGGRVLIGGEKEAAFADYKLFCSDTVALAVHDRVHYGSLYFDVIFVKDTLNMGHHKVAYLKKVT